MDRVELLRWSCTRRTRGTFYGGSWGTNAPKSALVIFLCQVYVSCFCLLISHCLACQCVKNMLNSFDLFRASCTCSEACWILHTPRGDVPSGYLTLVSFTVEMWAMHDATNNGNQFLSIVSKCSGSTDKTCCCLSNPNHTLPSPCDNIQYWSLKLHVKPFMDYTGFPALIFLRKKKKIF